MRRLTGVLAATVIAAVGLALVGTSQSHPISKRSCIGLGNYQKYKKCMKVQKRHSAHHRRQAQVTRCVKAPGRMTRKTCAALVQAAISERGIPTRWAWDPKLHELYRRESTWSLNAVNERSGACGIAQRLPCPWKYRGGNAGPKDDRVYVRPVVQCRNALRYIKDRPGYGTPARALAFHNSHGWY